jgi:ribonucleoside-diphosphate reductase alpha chain
MKWLNKESREFLSRGYLLGGVTPEKRIRQIADKAEEILDEKGFSDKFYSYMEKGWYSLATPIWLNFGLDRGLPISCYGIDIQDDTYDILRANAEIGAFTKNAGGTAGYFGKLRPRGAKIRNNGVSNGSVSFMQPFQTTSNVITQGQARRGYFAAYTDADHGDVEEFLECREEGSIIQDISLGLCFSDEFMKEALKGDKRRTTNLARFHKKRFESGFPYAYFTDNVNRQRPQVYKDKGMFLKTSQMCTEIMEYGDEDVSFVCCLSSQNMLYFDDWKGTDVTEVLTKFLYTVYEDFIEKAKNIPFMEKAVKFAREHKSIGVGLLGLHSYLQSKMIAFESLEAKMISSKAAKHLNEHTLIVSKELAKRFGEPKLLKGYGEMFTTRCAIAPTTSSSFILEQVSPSIELLQSNYFIKDLAKGKYTYRNPYLKKLLEEKGKDTIEIWRSILKKGGSVQHLNFLSEHEKKVFKTFGEVSQLEIIQNAAAMQSHIDQGISLNLMVHPDTSLGEVNRLFYTAWELGLKTLYYQRSANLAQEVSRDLMECESCSG